MPTQPPPPAQDDGARSLKSAAKSLIVAGALLLLTTVVLGDILLVEFRSPAFAGLLCLAWALPAAGLVACGIALKQHQQWACAGGRILAAVYALAATAAAVASATYGAKQEPVAGIVGALFYALVAWAFATLPRQLTQASQYIDSQRRGFEPIMKNASEPPPAAKHE